MSSDLDSVIISKEPDGSFVAHHTPSGKKTAGASMESARDAMRELLGMDDEGAFTEPVTSDRFSGIGRDVARFLEGPVSEKTRSSMLFPSIKPLSGPAGSHFCNAFRHTSRLRLPRLACWPS